MATMNVSLPDAMKTWVERQVESDRYGNTSDYVRELIRRDQERQHSIAILQAAVTAGVDSGTPEPFDADAFKQIMRQKHGAR